MGDPFIPEHIPRRRISERNGWMQPTVVVRNPWTPAVRSDLETQLLWRRSAKQLPEELTHSQHLVVEDQHYAVNGFSKQEIGCPDRKYDCFNCCESWISTGWIVF